MFQQIKTMSIVGLCVVGISLTCLMVARVDLFKLFTASLSPSTQQAAPLEWYASDYTSQGPTDGKTTWDVATSYCASLPTTGGTYPGVAWRLPTIDELMATHNVSAPANLQPWYYWSSTEVEGDSASAYDLDMTSAIVSPQENIGKILPDDYVRCVRNAIIYPPDAPTNISAMGGDKQMTISFTAPESDGGSPITLYTVTSNPDNITATGTASPITVTGLTNGTIYNFTVTASNLAGTSVPSVVSISVVPMGSGGGRINRDEIYPCTDFTYSDWSDCVDSVQTRTVLSSSPAGCTVPGGLVALTQVCGSPTTIEWYDADTPSDKTDWYTASSTCASLTTDGGGWRLPLMSELIAKHQETNSLPAGFQSSYYWSGTSDSNNNDNAYVVLMSTGTFRTFPKNRPNSSVTSYVRCVR